MEILKNKQNSLPQQVDENMRNIEKLANDKQDTLVSGENIKTINNQSILGSGNIDIQGGGGGGDSIPIINITEDGQEIDVASLTEPMYAIFNPNEYVFFCEYFFDDVDFETFFGTAASSTILRITKRGIICDIFCIFPDGMVNFYQLNTIERTIGEEYKNIFGGDGGASIPIININEQDQEIDIASLTEPMYAIFNPNGYTYFCEYYVGGQDIASLFYSQQSTILNISNYGNTCDVFCIFPDGDVQKKTLNISTQQVQSQVTNLFSGSGGQKYMHNISTEFEINNQNNESFKFAGSIQIINNEPNAYASIGLFLHYFMFDFPTLPDKTILANGLITYTNGQGQTSSNPYQCVGFGVYNYNYTYYVQYKYVITNNQTCNIGSGTISVNDITNQVSQTTFHDYVTSI